MWWWLACTPQVTAFVNPEQVYVYLPFGGTRTWSYVQDPVADNLVATNGNATFDDEGRAVYAVDFDSVAMPGGAAEWVRTISWSSTVQDGILVHAVETPLGGVMLDPPLVVCDVDIPAKGTGVSTTTDNAEWTSTYVDREACPGPLSWECLHFVVDGGDGSAAGSELVGDWWLTVGQGVAGFDLAGDSDATWGLDGVVCDPCSGDW